MHPFNTDLYGRKLKVCICGYLRPEKNFDSLESLVQAIKKDISDAEEQLDTDPFKSFKTDQFFAEQ